ncbi:MAG: hypothetical protein KKF50_00140 [Nanoarchaeota archaeon]|nr:hypothetical protein [Nanoarchaeota archaeon]
MDVESVRKDMKVAQFRAETEFFRSNIENLGVSEKKIYLRGYLDRLAMDDGSCLEFGTQNVSFNLVYTGEKLSKNPELTEYLIKTVREAGMMEDANSLEKALKSYIGVGDYAETIPKPV